MLTALTVFALAPPAQAEQQTVTLSVNTGFEPFVFYNEAGYTGFTIDLWNEITKRLNLNTIYIETSSVKAQLEDVATGKARIAGGAISITEDRARHFDFSQPMMNAGLQILTPTLEHETESEPALKPFLHILFSTRMLSWLTAALILAILPATLIWLLERGKMLDKSWRKGIPGAYGWTISALAGSASDDPRRGITKVIAVTWAFIGIIFISDWTANLTSTLTVQKFEATVSGPADLFNKKVCTVANTTSSTFAKNFGLTFTTMPNIKECYRALGQGNIDAVIFDAPVLQYYATHDGAGAVITAGPVFKEEDYGFVFQTGDPLRKDVDSAILAMREDGTYNLIKGKWFATE